MHDSGAAVAEPDDAPLSLVVARPRRPARDASGGVSLPLPGLLDTRLVRAELTRLGSPRRGSRTVVGRSGVRIASSSTA